jgi:hypothetical protein
VIFIVSKTKPTKFKCAVVTYHVHAALFLLDVDMALWTGLFFKIDLDWGVLGTDLDWGVLGTDLDWGVLGTE